MALVEAQNSGLGANDHGSLLGLADDDHAQYLLLAGRAGGQSAVGGTGAGEELALRGSSNANLGLIRAQSPIDFGDTSAANALSPYTVRDASTSSFTAGFIGGTFGDLRNVTFSNGLFIYETLRGSPIITSNVSPAFGAFTLFNALPQLRSGSGASHNPLQMLILNAGGQLYHGNTGTRTVASATAVNHATTLQGALSGGTLNITAYTSVQLTPTWNTVAGSTVNFGTIRGLWARNPAQALFGSSAGTELMSAYVAVDVDNITFGGNVTKRALRSAITAATNARFIENTGGADSDFGAGDAHFNDGAGVALGNTVASPDVLLNWTGSAFEWDPAVGSDLRITFGTSTRTISSSSASNTDEILFDIPKFAFGQGTPVGNQKGLFVANSETVTVAGEFSQFLLTQSGNDTINAALSLYAGWTINVPTPTIGSGSITTQAGLNIGGNPAQATTNRVGLRILSNPSGGSGVNAALWVTAGRTRLDGVLDINAPVALGGGSTATLGTIGGSGPATAAQNEWVQIEVNGNTRWIPVWA